MVAFLEKLSTKYFVNCWKLCAKIFIKLKMIPKLRTIYSFPNKKERIEEVHTQDIKGTKTSATTFFEVV